MKLPCKKSEVVYLFWKDAQSGWDRVHMENPKSLELATNGNFGWVVDENEERLVFANGASSTGEFDLLKIPTGNIVGRIYVNPPKGKKKTDGQAETK